MLDARRKKILAVGAIYLAIAAISVLHYVSPVHAHYLHDVYRRLYYLPIILSAFLLGFKGGLVAAAVVCLAYAPHAFGRISHDPATDTQKILEMFLYFAVGLTTGSLVSRLKRSQNDLQKNLELLRSAETELVQTAKLAAVGRLSAGLAHEIRNPLASIRGSAEILADDFPTAHPKHRLLQVLIAETARLNRVLTRFLDFARPRPLARDQVDLCREIESVVDLIRGGQSEGHAARFVLDPANDARVRLQGDREQLRQVLLNLLLNATQAAGENGEVRVRCEERAGACRVTIADSGPGFAPEAIENAFTPFFTTKPQGIGLGLAMSHRIVESHGGTIRVGNQKDGGGLVELEIPLERGEHVTDPAHRR
jgi:two-component system, NtrC family, sensor histidine kinase HydH